MESSIPQTVESPLVSRLALRNYKSIGACEIGLSRLTALVGPNGAGKSNFLDSLRFVSDSLRYSVEHALQTRGGIGEVRRRSKGHPTHFAIRLEMNLHDGSAATYAFRIGASKGGMFTVQQEKCLIEQGGFPAQEHAYHLVDGQLVSSSSALRSAIEPDRLYLGVVSALPEFRPLYDALTHMGFYNLIPERIRDLQDPDPSEVLKRDGSNIASVLGRLAGDDAAKARIEEYLGAVVPGLRGVDIRHLGPKETVEFRQEVPGDDNPWRFLAANMSDGTLRVLGILVALFQGAANRGKSVQLIGIEEPELALHPAAANALASAIREASARTQVVMTSHSPDLLDNQEFSSDNILAVTSQKGQTVIGPVDKASRQALREGLYTPGELLRLQQLQPEPEPPEQTGRQLDLFRNGVPR